MTDDLAIKALLRRADQHGELSRLRPCGAARRGDRPGARLRQPLRQGVDAFGRQDPRGGRGRGRRDRMGARDACPRRPSFGRALREAEDRRQGRHRRAHPRRAEDLPAGVQSHRRFRRRIGVRPSFQGWRALHDRRARRRGHLHARPHAGLRLLQDRGRGVCRRYHVHARLRHGARRFSRRRRARAVALHAAPAVAPRRRRGSSCATTTRRPAATAMRGRRRSERSGRT